MLNRFWLLSLLGGLLGFLLPSSSFANNTPGRMKFEVSGDFSTTGRPGAEATRGSQVLFNYEAELTLGLLFGDPVVSLRMKVDPVGGIVTVPRFEPGEDRYETINLDQLPTAMAEAIHLYDVKLAFHFEHPGFRDVLIIADAGAFGQHGEWAFNVPGSPDWDALFMNTGNSLDGDYLAGEEAKTFWLSGLTLETVEVASAHLMLGDMQTLWATGYDRPRFEAANRAIDRLREGIRASYGYTWPATDPYTTAQSSQIQALTSDYSLGVYVGIQAPDLISEWQKAYAYAKDALSRILNLPDNLRIGDYHAPYRQAVQDALDMVKQGVRWRSEFRPDGPFIGDFEQGRPGQFDGNIAVARDASGVEWYVDIGTQQKIRERRRGEVLIEGTMVISEYTVRCSEDKVRLPIRNALTDEVIQVVELPCAQRHGWWVPVFEDMQAKTGFVRLDAIVLDGNERLIKARRSGCGWYITETQEVDGTRYAISPDGTAERTGAYRKTTGGESFVTFCLQSNP